MRTLALPSTKKAAGSMLILYTSTTQVSPTLTCLSIVGRSTERSMIIIPGGRTPLALAILITRDGKIMVRQKPDRPIAKRHTMMTK